MSSSPEGAQFGWGGFFGDAVQSSVGNGAVFTNITTGGGDLLITGQQTAPYQIDPQGAQLISLLEESEDTASSNLLREHFRASRFQTANLLWRDMAAKIQSSFDANAQFNAALQSASQLATQFPKVH